jgi:hypothetical protein
MRWHQATLTCVGILGMSRAFDLVLFVSRLRRLNGGCGDLSNWHREDSFCRSAYHRERCAKSEFMHRSKERPFRSPRRRSKTATSATVHSLICFHGVRPNRVTKCHRTLNAPLCICRSGPRHDANKRGAVGLRKSQDGQECDGRRHHQESGSDLIPGACDYLLSVLPRCHQRSIWHRLYRKSRPAYPPSLLDACWAKQRYPSRTRPMSTLDY